MLKYGILRRSLFALLILAFLLTGFAVSSHGGMDMRMDGEMVDCPFMPGVFICSMTPLEMIAVSQYSFASLPQQKNVIATLTLLLATLALAILWKPFVPLRLAPLRIEYRPRRSYISPHNPLQEIFSSGILNPKTY